MSYIKTNNLQILTLEQRKMLKRSGDALEAYSRLTEAEKEEIINQCRDAKSKAEMDRIISRLSGNWF